MSWPEIVGVLRDAIVSLAAVTGSVVAVKGLGTWRRQLKGQSEYELSRRILVALFKYRDAISGVRHPMMWAHEIPTPPAEQAEKMSREQISFYGTSKAYQARWDKLQSERSSLYADLLEAEAIWGADLKGLFKNVFDLQHELWLRIRNHLELVDPDADPETKDALRKIETKHRDIMYDDLSEEGDEFRKDLVSAIEKIELYLKPKLHHEQV